MKRRELEREGKKWVKEGIITEDQLTKILNRKQDNGPNFIIILFAILLTGLGFITFIMSDWAREPHLSRVLIILAVTAFFYFLGDMLYKKSQDLYGISFIVLGYIVFGSGLLLVIDIYQVTLFSVWPFTVWTFVGLVLYLLYKHPILFCVTILVSTIGQIYSGVSFAGFNWILFVLTILGAGYFAYREGSNLFYYILAINFSLQSIVFTATIFEHYYWFMIPMLVLYGIGEWLRVRGDYSPIHYIALASIFLFGMYQTFLLQDEWYIPQIPDFDIGFFIIWLILVVGLFVMKWQRNSREELIDLILFLPIVFLPLNYVLNLIVLFIFALGWIFIGYKNDHQESIMIGTIAFLFSTLTVYVQYAWDALNKSLFFLIGGIILFLISFIIEKQRRKLWSKQEGSDKR